jgi:hypothetical protein
VRFRVGSSEVVAIEAAADAVREALLEGTLYEYAARHPRAREFTGRGAAYAVPLPDLVTQVVVRRSRHGGFLAPVTGDRFLAPTRAPRELRSAVRLAACGVRTPELVAYATYPAGPLLRRSDVATREVPRGKDLAVALLNPPAGGAKQELLRAAAGLVAALGRCGARHPDLNLKNVLLAPGAGSRNEAWVLDVDRVTFGRAGDPAITRANLDRLTRSARKWRELYGAAISEAELAQLAEDVHAG